VYERSRCCSEHLYTVDRASHNFIYLFIFNKINGNPQYCNGIELP